MNLLHALTFGANALVAMLVAQWLSSPAPRAWQALLIAVGSILWSLCTTSADLATVGAASLVSDVSLSRSDARDGLPRSVAECR